MEICTKYWYFGKCRGQFLHENTVFAPNPSYDLKIKYSRFQSMWNLKIDFVTIFWYILTLHPHNSKSSLLTTGTFWYVESHIYLSYILWCLMLSLYTYMLMSYSFVFEHILMSYLLVFVHALMSYGVFVYICWYHIQFVFVYILIFYFSIG